MTDKGVSLIEVVIAVVLIGFIILVVSNLPAALGIIGGSRQETLVRDIATKKIEDIRSQGYDNLADGTSTIVDTRLAQLAGGSAESAIELCPITVCTSGEQAKKVTVTVNWLEQGKAKSAQITTFVAKGGLQ